MNIIEINQDALESFSYNEIKGFLSFLEHNPKENKGTLMIRFPELEEVQNEPLFLNKSIRAWYMGLMYNTPNLLYFLADDHDTKRQWTDLQFAMMMFGTVKVKEKESELMRFEVKMSEEIFQHLVQSTAEYMIKVSGNERLTNEEEEFFSHLIFDYTNGFDTM